MKYKVTSKVIRLEQLIRGTTKIHDNDYPRTIDWLKDDDKEEFLSNDEATQLKNYLDKKNNFSNNEIVLATLDEIEPSLIEIAFTARNISNQKISIDDPIQISQCSSLKDYNLNFRVVGHLNVNKLI